MNAIVVGKEDIVNFERKTKYIISVSKERMDVYQISIVETTNNGYEEIYYKRFASALLVINKFHEKQKEHFGKIIKKITETDLINLDSNIPK